MTNVRKIRINPFSGAETSVDNELIFCIGGFCKGTFQLKPKIDVDIPYFYMGETPYELLDQFKSVITPKYVYTIKFLFNTISVAVGKWRNGSTTDEDSCIQEITLWYVQYIKNGFVAGPHYSLYKNIFNKVKENSGTLLGDEIITTIRRGKFKDCIEDDDIPF